MFDLIPWLAMYKQLCVFVGALMGTDGYTVREMGGRRGDRTVGIRDGDIVDAQAAVAAAKRRGARGGSLFWAGRRVPVSSSSSESPNRH